MSDPIDLEDEETEERGPKRGLFGRWFGRKGDDPEAEAGTETPEVPETSVGEGPEGAPGSEGDAEASPGTPVETHEVEAEPVPDPPTEGAADEPRRGLLGRLLGRGSDTEEASSGEKAPEQVELPAAPAQREPGAEAAPVAEGAVARTLAPVETDARGRAPGEGPPEAEAKLEATAEEGEEPRTGFFGRLRKGLSRTRGGFVQRVDRILLGKKEIDAETLEELEEVLVTADLGMNTVMRLVDDIQERVARKELSSPDALREHLKAAILEILSRDEAHLVGPEQGPVVIMVVGVNGVGKTTTIGKVAARYAREGKKVVLGAGDTFRAAAIEQLEIWGGRVGAQVVRHQDGSDPAAVAYDAVEAAKARGADVVIIDTAGRLHTKKNLMEELKKVRRVIGKALPGAPHQVLLVLDATTGQNAVSQAKLFHQAVGIDALALTKLDGTAKGGVVVAVSEEVSVPIAYIGVGEQVDDLRPFEAEPFVEALFERSS